MRESWSQRDGEGDRAEEQGTGKGLANDFRHRPATELQGVPQIPAQHVAAVAEKLLRKGSGETVFFLQHRLGAWIQRPLRGEGGAGSDADEQEAERQDRENNRY